MSGSIETLVNQILSDYHKKPSDGISQISEYIQEEMRFIDTSLLSPPETCQDRMIPELPVKRETGASKLEKDGKYLKVVYDPDGIPYIKPAHLPCYTCGSPELWESKSGVIICCVCHPPVCEDDILRRWNVFDVKINKNESKMRE
jgi:hypothetical protein